MFVDDDYHQHIFLIDFLVLKLINFNSVNYNSVYDEKSKIPCPLSSTSCIKCYFLKKMWYSPWLLKSLSLIYEIVAYLGCKEQFYYLFPAVTWVFTFNSVSYKLTITSLSGFHSTAHKFQRKLVSNFKS